MQLFLSIRVVTWNVVCQDRLKTTQGEGRIFTSQKMERNKASNIENGATETMMSDKIIIYIKNNIKNLKNST